VNSESLSVEEGNVRKKNAAIARVATLLFETIALIVCFAQRAAAQGCAACYESATASGAQGRAALRHGILILLIPTLSLVGLIVGIVYKRRNVSR
jgi:hypothetical protein